MTYESSLIDVKKHITNNGLDDTITIIPDWSYNVFDQWDKPLDFLLVDGAHEYNSVSRDCEFMDLIKPGGYAAFDDWLAGVEQAVNDFISTRPEWEYLHKSTTSPSGPYLVTLLRKKYNK